MLLTCLGGKLFWEYLGYLQNKSFKKKSLEGSPQSIAYRNLGHSIWGKIPIDIVAYIVHIEEDPLVK